MKLQENDMIIVKRFLDKDGHVRQLPVKQKTLILVLAYLAQAFEHNKIYSEGEVNAIIQDNCTVDHFLTRRSLIDLGFLGRKMDGSEYWRMEEALPV